VTPSRISIGAAVPALVAALGACGVRASVHPVDGTSYDDSPPTDVEADGADGGATCGAAIATCNPVANAGCAAGTACYATGPSTAMCTAPGTHRAGELCSRPADCLPGLVCITTSMDSMARCYVTCCSPNDNDRCHDTSVGGTSTSSCGLTVPGSNYRACTQPSRCNWFTQNCASGGNCLPVDAVGNTQCWPAGPAGAGASCTTDNCGPGLVCLGPSRDQAICRAVCDPTFRGSPDAGGSRACPSGFSCLQVPMTPANFGGCFPQ
jgi:hypothetical protein